MSTSQCAVYQVKDTPEYRDVRFRSYEKLKKRRKNSPDRKLSSGVYWKNPAGGKLRLTLKHACRSSDRKTSKVIPSVAAM